MIVKRTDRSLLSVEPAAWCFASVAHVFTEAVQKGSRQAQKSTASLQLGCVLARLSHGDRTLLQEWMTNMGHRLSPCNPRL